MTILKDNANSNKIVLIMQLLDIVGDSEQLIK